MAKGVRGFTSVGEKLIAGLFWFIDNLVRVIGPVRVLLGQNN
jgi:hypothetical protein